MILTITLILLGVNYLVAVGIGIGMLTGDSVTRDGAAGSDLRVTRWMEAPKWLLMIPEA